MTIADPEEKNDDRADWAYEAVQTFQAATGLDKHDGLDTAIMDLLCDLAHLCDREGLDLAKLLNQASYHYEEETSPDNGDADEGEQGTQFDCIDIFEPRPKTAQPKTRFNSTKVVEHWDEISDALGRAADAIEDIDDPRHYSKDDLKEIRRKAVLWRKLANLSSS